MARSPRRPGGACRRRWRPRWPSCCRPWRPSAPCTTPTSAHASWSTCPLPPRLCPTRASTLRSPTGRPCTRRVSRSCSTAFCRRWSTRPPPTSRPRRTWSSRRSRPSPTTCRRSWPPSPAPQSRRRRWPPTRQRRVPSGRGLCRRPTRRWRARCAAPRTRWRSRRPPRRSSARRPCSAGCRCRARDATASLLSRRCQQTSGASSGPSCTTSANSRQRRWTGRCSCGHWPRWSTGPTPTAPASPSRRRPKRPAGCWLTGRGPTNSTRRSCASGWWRCGRRRPTPRCSPPTTRGTTCCCSPSTCRCPSPARRSTRAGWQCTTRRTGPLAPGTSGSCVGCRRGGYRLHPCRRSTDACTGSRRRSTWPGLRRSPPPPRSSRPTTR
mmetsp:Transcript_32850/g.106202  ORF Transcript_32850/g.106202 Transcript_32850/m.106202 type:complete len:381 (+) Transcript_32850:772-1914(+)